MEILSGFLIGFFGSFHCVGMCGPIALMLPSAGDSGFEKILSRLFYNLGRVLTYGLMGLAFGFLGEGLHLKGFQQTLSILLGSIILIYVAAPRRFKSKLFSWRISIKLNSFVKNKLAGSLKNNSSQSMFVIGMINGLLPCGFVYMALGGAITLSDPLFSMLYMVLFGLGTIPVMLSASLIGRRINIEMRRKISSLLPYLAALLALLFILRGMNLGIPYVSPKLNTVHYESVNK